MWLVVVKIINWGFGISVILEYVVRYVRYVNFLVLDDLVRNLNEIVIWIRVEFEIFSFGFYLVINVCVVVVVVINLGVFLEFVVCLLFMF